MQGKNESMECKQGKQVHYVFMQGKTVRKIKDKGRRMRSKERMEEWQVRHSRKISQTHLEGKQLRNIWKEEGREVWNA